MQVFANVATAPQHRTTKSSNRNYWEFRAAESAKNEAKESATWFTVRVFQDEDPGLVKGDFVRLIGKLKLDVFMGREGKPMGVLVIMCYEAKKYSKTKPTVAGGNVPNRESIGSPQGSARQPRVTSAAIELPVDESWLALVR